MKDVISSMKLIRESRYIPTEAKREFDAVMPLVERFGELGPNARRILLALADRLVVGIPHGDFDKPYDWDKESSEEALDLAVYQAAKLLGLGAAPSRSSPELEDAERGRDLNEVRIADGPFNGSYFCAKTGNFLCSTDGRTSDGMPWVPPAGARVRIVHVWKESAFLRKGGDTTRAFVVSAATAFDEDKASIDFKGLERYGYLLRVVPA